MHPARTILFLFTASVLPAQQYLVSTLAGGAPPPTPVPATVASFAPPNGLVVDSSGNVFFTSVECVFRLGKDGTLTRVAGIGRRGFSGDGGPAVSAELGVGGVNSGPGGGLTIDSVGNLYLADSENNRVRRVSVSGIITTIAGNGTTQGSGDGGPAVNASVVSPGAVAIDGEGNLFIVEQQLGRIRKVSPDGRIATVANIGLPSSVSPAVSTGLALDNSGNLFVSDTFHNLIWKVSSTGATTTIAGTGTRGFSGDGGPAVNAEIANPRGLAFDSVGNLHFVDSVNFRIRKISADGTITTVAGGGGTFPGNGVRATAAVLYDPLAIAIDSQDNLYISAGWIQKMSKDGIISIVGGNGNANFGGDGGLATAAQIWEPTDVALDSAGNVFIADSANEVIRKVGSNGTISTVAGNGGHGYLGDHGPAIDATFAYPSHVAVDTSGNLFIADSGNNRIRMVAPNGTITTVAGNGTAGNSGDGGPATQASLKYPLGVAIDGAGNLFIADYENNRVRKVAKDGTISTVAGTGVGGFSGDGGPATAAQLFIPSALAFDTSGNLFILDLGNSRVRKVSPDGSISTFAGGGSIANASDGTLAVNASLYAPAGLALDGSNNLFISGGLGFILQVKTDGTIRNITNGAGPSIAGDGVPAATAYLGSVQGLRVDSAGRIYVADSSNSVRTLQPVSRQVLIGAVVDGAGQRATPISPGKIVAIYGAGMGPAQLVSNQPKGGVFSTQVAGTTVSFNGIPAPVLYASSTVIGAVVPYGIEGTTVQVTVAFQGNASDPFPVPTAGSSPSLFSSNGSGAGQAAAVNTDGSLNDAAHPVQPGGYLSLYATGEGQTQPPGQDGSLAALSPPFPAPMLPVSVSVGGQPATVLYAGAAPGEIAGLMQVVIQIPAGVEPGGYVPVVMQVGSVSTTNGATWIAVAKLGSN